jgi:hypothetical protein
LLARPADFAALPDSAENSAMDALMQVLGTVRMNGAVFFELECRSPWGLAVPSADAAAALLPPGPVTS